MKTLVVVLIVGLFPVLSQAYMDPSTALDPDGTRAANDIEAKCETAMPNFMSDKPRKEKQKEFSRHAACVKSNFGAHIMKRAEYEKTKLTKEICLTDKPFDQAQDCDTPEFRQQLYDLTITDFYCFSVDFYAPLENRKPACPWKK